MPFVRERHEPDAISLEAKQADWEAVRLADSDLSHFHMFLLQSANTPVFVKTSPTSIRINLSCCSINQHASDVIMGTRSSERLFLTLIEQFCQLLIGYLTDGENYTFRAPICSDLALLHFSYLLVKLKADSARFFFCCLSVNRFPVKMMCKCFGCITSPTYATWFYDQAYIWDLPRNVHSF